MGRVITVSPQVAINASAGLSTSEALMSATQARWASSLTQISVTHRLSGPSAPKATT